MPRPKLPKGRAVVKAEPPAPKSAKAAIDEIVERAKRPRTRALSQAEIDAAVERAIARAEARKNEQR
jgi:hypothetical protein